MFPVSVWILKMLLKQARKEGIIGSKQGPTNTDQDVEKELNWIVAYLFLMMVKILGFGHLAYNKSLHIIIIFGMTYEGNSIFK